MSGECLCGEIVGNLGKPHCTPKIGKILRPVFQSRYQDDGTENYLDTTVALNAAYWNAKQYHADTKQRIYPLPIDMEDVESPKEDTVYKVYGSGKKVKIRQGFRNITGTLPVAAAAMVGKINARGCNEDAAYYLTTLGILGIRKEAGKVHPIPQSMDALDGKFDFQNETDPQRITLMMQWIQSVNDAQLVIIKYSDIVGIDLLAQLTGMLDANITQVAAARSTTTFSLDIALDYGDGVEMIPVEGLVTADFAVHNVTDNLAAALTSVTEDPNVPGRYAFVLAAAQTATDILRVSLNATANAQGFDDATWAAVEVELQ